MARRRGQRAAGGDPRPPARTRRDRRRDLRIASRHAPRSAHGKGVRTMKHKLLPLIGLTAVIAAVTAAVAFAAVHATGGFGGYGSMMGGSGYSMMGPHGVQSSWYLERSGPVTDIATARTQAQKFADRLGLRTDEVMQFTDNFYVLLVDQQGKPAAEVLVDPETGAVTLEYGPAMMWNTKYGMMSGTGTASGGYGGMMGSGGMMGGSVTGSVRAGMGGMMSGMMGSYGGRATWTPGTTAGSVDVTQARNLANTWLAKRGSGLTTGDVDALPGYYTFEVLKDGRIGSMLSVNATTGAGFYHLWHGTFVAKEG